MLCQGDSMEPKIFLSTLSLRRATALRPCKYTGYFRYFYPRSPCGERRLPFIINSSTQNISIHALLAESDLSTSPTLCVCVLFLSTLSLRRATINRSAKVSTTVHFYPRSPCGERPYWRDSANTAKQFLSTLSLRRAT